MDLFLIYAGKSVIVILLVVVVTDVDVTVVPVIVVVVVIVVLDKVTITAAMIAPITTRRANRDRNKQSHERRPQF